MIELIVATDLGFGIGNDNKLLTHLRDDLKFFKETTKGKTMIMGRKTFESLPGKLPGRTHVVISRDANFMKDDDEVFTFTSLESALESYPTSIIIGGGEIYKKALNIDCVDTIYLTLILNNFIADTQFPEIPENFLLKSSVSISKDEKNKENFIINTFQKF